MHRPDPVAVLRWLLDGASRALDAVAPSAGSGPEPGAGGAGRSTPPSPERTAQDALAGAVAAQRWQRTVAAVSDAVCTLDLRGTVTGCGPACLAVLGWTPQELVGRRLHHLAHDDDAGVVAAVVDAIAAGTVSREVLEVRLRDGRGAWRWREVTLAGVPGDTGAVMEVLAVVRDVHDRRMTVDRPVGEGTVDALTGLRNRRGLLDLLASVAGSGRPVAVVSCDLDGFRAVNEELGDDAGDEVLVEVADRLALVVRSSDGVARVRGDRFVLVLPGADLAGALAVGERAVQVVREPVVTAGGTANLTVSVGVAHAERVGADPLALLVSADEAVARAKVQGCDRLVLAV